MTDEAFVPVAKVAEIAPGHSRVIAIDGTDVAVFNVGGRFFALDNTCPHQGGPLDEGWIDGETVTCPWHAWCFKMSDGKMTLGDFASVDPYDVRIDGDTVLVSRRPRAA